MALVQKAFSDIITFSRSSNATRVGPTGLVEYAPHNLLQRSQEFDNAYWTKTNATVTANSIAAPDGTVTADTHVSSASGGSLSNLSVNVGTLTNGQTYTVSRYVKAGSKAFCTLGLFGLADAYFDLNNTTYSFSGTGAVSASIVDVGNGWKRITATWTWGSGTTYTLFLGMASSLSSQTGLSVGDYIYVWGAQLSVGPYPLDYTPTTSAAVYGPRFDYDPVTLAARGLLVEEQRTNLMTNSEDFSGWTLNGATVTTNTVSAPDGTTTADTITGSSGNFRIYKLLTISSGQAYTFSWFAKKGTSDTLTIDFVNVGDGPIFTFSTESWSASGSWTTTVQKFGGGWYRLTATATSNTTTAGPGVRVSGASATAYIWGFQVEAGSFATSYIPTLASTVTRSADVATINTLSPFFNATEGTMFAQFDSAASGTNTIAAFDDNTANENYRLRNVGTDPKFTVTDGGVDQCDINGGTIAANTVYNFAAAYKANDFAACIAGGTVQTDTSGTLPTVDRLRIGTSQAGNYLNGHVRRFAYFPRRLQNAELQSLTS